MGGEAVGVALEVGAPGAGGLVEVVVADVGGDGGVHAAYDAVEDAFFEAAVVECERVWGGGVGLNDVAKVVFGLEEAHRVAWGQSAVFLGEAIFSVDGVPDVGACVAGKSLGVVN